MTALQNFVYVIKWYQQKTELFIDTKIIFERMIELMSVFSSNFKRIAKRATAWSLAALTAAAGFAAMPDVLTTKVNAASVLSNEDRGVIFANSRTDFRDESIYFLITTRFYDGDSSNNARKSEDKKARNPENDPSWRGDFKGLIDKLDYIKALGFTAIWITPVVENDSGYDYHGYHAYDFSAVDKRYESNGVTYQTLIDACHQKGMKVIQDVVFNHTCNWGERNLLKLESDVFTERNSVVMNGKYGPGGQYTDTENIYHHNGYCGGGDWDEYAAQNKTIADDCLDLETENPKVYNYLIDCYKKYIDMGVDAFRVDTVKHISRLTLNSTFVPQLMEEAKKTGNDKFYMFGEICTKGAEVWYRGCPPISTCFYTWADDAEWTGKWSTDLASNEALVEAHHAKYNDTSIQPTSNNGFLNGNDYHTPDYSKRSGLDAIDFQMHWTFESAGHAFGTALGQDQYFNDPTWNVVYVDSHDYAPDVMQTIRPNFGTNTWAENLSLMFTFRGIPCVFYGSEIEFQAGKPIDVGPNQPLANTGRAYYGDNIEGTVGTNDFTVYGNLSGQVAETLKSPLSQHIMRLNRIRQAIPALRKGQYSVEGCSSNGGIAFKRRYTDSSTDSFVCVAISSGATFSGIPNGTYVDAVTGDTQTVSGGTLTANVSGQGNMKVYVLNTAKTPAPGRVITNGTYLNDGGAAELIQPVTIVEGPTVDVTSVKLDKTSVSIPQATTATVTATVSPSDATNKTIKWTSSDESVATVSGGVIKGVSIGTATITATSNNGKTATVKVSVIKNPDIVDATGITVSPSSLTLTAGGTDTLTATVTPSNATDKTVTWTSSNTGVATVSNGTVTAVAEGTATITAKTSNGKTATATVTVEGKKMTYIDNGVYFEKPSGWGSTINAYIYGGASETQITGTWPGKPMKEVGDGIYAYEFTTDLTNVKVIFNDGSNQAPGSQQPGFEFKNKGLYTSNGFQKIVEPQQDVEVTSVSVSPASASVKVGATTTLSATVSPSNATNKAVTWTSSNTSVATVSNGVVTGVAKGTATITVTTSNGKTAKATVTVTKDDDPTPTLVNNSTISATSVTLGNTVTVKGAASGGVSPYKYAVYYKASTSSTWSTQQDFASTTSVSIKFAGTGTKNVCVKVKDSAGTVTKKYFTVTVKADALTNNSKISATEINLGNTVTLTGAASGGTGSYTYAMLYKKTSSSSWTTAQNFSTSKTASIKPASATTYDVCVKVQDSAGTVEKKFFTLKVTAPALVNNSTVSATSVTLGNTITVKGAATGGTTPYKYAVYYKASSATTWTTKQDFSTTASVSIKFAGTGTKDICVKVKDSAGTVEKKYFTVKVTNAALANTSTVSATTVALGNAITVKGAATGGTTPYKYAVYYKASSATTWTEKQAFSTNASVSIKFAGTGTKDVCVKVKDNTGTVVKKYFTVTVNSNLTNNSTVSATSVTKGGKVTVKFAAANGTSPYTYKVERMLVGGSAGWTTISNTSSTSTTVAIPTADTYQIRVTVTDSKKATSVKYFTVTGK